MLSMQEKEERKKQLGASEIYKILCFDSQECQNLWELKMGIQKYQELESDAIIAGNILEEDCLNYYAKTNNCELIFNERIKHKNIKKLVVSLDAREKDTFIPIENKVINENTWNNWKAKRISNAEYNGIKLNIPKQYYCQIQTQILALDTNYGILNVNTVTDEEQEDPLNVTITELHNKQITIYRDQSLIDELEKRAIYMINCIDFRLRPSEADYLEKNIF